MKLILESDGTRAYDLSDELAELDIVVEVDRLVESRFGAIRLVGDEDDTLKFLLASPWEQGCK